MNVRQRKNLIHILTALTLTAAIAAAATAFLSPLDVTLPDQNTGSSPANPAQPGAAHADQPAPQPAKPTRAQLQRIYALDLRKPLYGAPPQPAVASTQSLPASTAATLATRLIGTAHEPGHSMAIFRKPDGSSEWFTEGEKIDDPVGPVTILKISRDKVTITYAGRKQDLIVPPPPSASSAPTTGAAPQ